MATIDKRGEGQWRARVRRDGKSLTRTFETRDEAQAWALRIEGKIVGDEYQDRRKVQATSLAEACDWYLENLNRKQADAKNKVSKVSYWRSSEFASWSLVSLRPADLIRWRRAVLDEDNRDEDEIAGPGAKVGSQTVVHRLNVLSQIYAQWALAHDQTVTCPVVRGVRPSLPDGRSRRLDPNPDRDGRDEETRLLATAERSSRPWLKAAIVIALETCMRQSELAELTWDRVRLNVEDPFADLPKTKNDRPRRIPLSVRAVAAFETLKGASIIIGKRKVLPVETGRGIAHAFRAAISEDEFQDLRWHDLRHEAISRLFERTDLRDNEIMAISGHIRPEMLTRYTHLRADRLGSRLPGGRLNVHANR
ncbi:MAG: site-specific integrase [Alphaproteobacteria bacterium]|nr:site-specific integrase [Alphaproteobacteria bacterium]